MLVNIGYYKVKWRHPLSSLEIRESFRKWISIVRDLKDGRSWPSEVRGDRDRIHCSWNFR
jgi:hypothetical protein